MGSSGTLHGARKDGSRASESVRIICDGIAGIVTLTFVSHVSRAHGGLLLPACGEKVGMRGRFRESELVEAPPHRAEFSFSLGACRPLPATGAREAARLSNRSKCQR